MYFRVVESTAGYTSVWDLCTSPGIDNNRRDQWFLVSHPKDTGKVILRVPKCIDVEQMINNDALKT